MLLYVHVPFCRRKCTYCAFASQVPEGDDFALWERALTAEMELSSKRFGRPVLETVYFGGGTPSLLPAWLFGCVADAVRKNFEVPKGIEFTVEANPESADLHTLQDLVAAGATRLSLGVQSFADDDLRLLGRPHTGEQAVAAYEAARYAGFRNVGLDLIWGLPGQRTATWLRQLKVAAEKLRPEHLSCYSLTPEPGTPLAALLEGGQLALPGENEQSRMFMTGSAYLEGQGYLHYEISNFARMGFTSRHNTGYWEGKDYLGLGPSAVSTVGGRRWENPRGLAAWAEEALAGKSGARPEELDRATRLRELVMLSLRTSKGLSMAAYRELSGRSFSEEHGALLQALRRHGLVRISKGQVRLSANGMLVSNLILERLMGT
ncbi:oxygen-independent coproporphyrinogen III oxidase [Desulfovibrio sp. X2]|uniref:radical SAM family heme chaperone HemW n=1 Tax=Desulfovibrio sp. X2 TaxID=941449 RepID=UPI000358CD89|nr:radical SAM family heme chaperone HemW [Desulfovibrio sp. X2]EPR43954.1 oxygen-independent coproporphyrinogen III oxidase [Desulfovibrio sp. X2]